MIVDWSGPWSLLGGPRVVVWGMGGAAPPLPIDLIAAIYNYWYSNPTLTTAFPGGLKVRQSEFGTALPRAVVIKVGSGQDTRTTGRAYFLRELIQFNVYAANYEDSRDKAYLVQSAYHKNNLAFANGYVMAALASEPQNAPPGVAPGAEEEYMHIVEITYLVGRAMG